MLKVRDRLNNVVLATSVVVTPAATGPAGSTGGLINSSTPTSASGVVTFSNLGIGGTIGTWKVKFTSPNIKADSANVTITTGPAATIQTYMPPGPTAAADLHLHDWPRFRGVNVSPAPTGHRQGRVRQPGRQAAALTWAPLLGSNGSVLTVGAGWHHGCRRDRAGHVLESSVTA